MNNNSDPNPLTKEYDHAYSALTTLQASAQQVASEISWFDSVSEPELGKALSRIQDKLFAPIANLSELNSEIAEKAPELLSVESRIGSFFNPLNWFDDQQVKLREKRDRLRGSLTQLSARKSFRMKEIGELELQRSELKKTLGRYLRFNVSESHNRLVELEQKVEEHLSVFRVIEARKNKVDHALAPLLNERCNYEREIAAIKSSSESAEGYESRLSRANNSYERAKAHEACEREFGNGRPSAVIALLNRKLMGVTRNLEKLNIRISHEALKASREVGVVFIDGNNLCHANGTQFIGTSALEALMPKLDERGLTVRLFFDASIRALLNANDAMIKKRFPFNVKVHISATREDVDETLLEFASSDRTAYIISNDRYGEYRDKPIVKEGRLIRHEIFDGRIVINELDINLVYRTHGNG